MLTESHWPRLFAKLFGIGAAAIVALAFGNFESRRSEALTRLEADHATTVATQAAFFLDVLHRLDADLQILSRQTELQIPEPVALHRLAREYGDFVRATHNYQSIRLIDSLGVELMRAATDEFGGIHERIGIAPALPEDAGIVAALAQLAPEAKLLTSQADPTSIVPRPLWRLAIGTPDTDPHRRAVVALYRADTLFDRLARIGGNADTTLMLVSRTGVWSTVGRGLPRVWRYEPAGDAPPEPVRAYPAAWQTVTAEFGGTVQIANGFFVFRTISPVVTGFWGLDRNGDILPEASDWRIVAFVSPEAVARIEEGLLSSLVPTTIAALLAFGLISWFAAVRWQSHAHRHARLVQQATIDALTGALNRAAFEEGFRAALARHAATGESFALVYVDLDDFKAVNDRFGHDAGDACLVETVRRIRAVTREGDLLGRLGGDEFAVLLAPLKGRAAAEAILDKVRTALAIGPPPFAGSGGPIAASLGVALCPDDGRDAEMLLRVADRAMYGAKRRHSDPAS